MADVIIVAEDIVVQDLDHGLNEFSNSFSSKTEKKKYFANTNEQNAKHGVSKTVFFATNYCLSLPS